MNTHENTPRRAARPRRRLTAAPAVALFLGTAFALALATGARLMTETGADARAQRDERNKPSGPAVRPRPGHSDYLVGLTRKAQGEGFGREGVALLRAGRGAGQAAVAGRLRRLADGRRFGARITSAGLRQAPANDRGLAFVGPNSSLKVSADGTKFRFHANLDGEASRAGAQAREIAKDEVERLGRQFVGEALADFVRLGRDETLVFLGVKYLREEGFDAEGKDRRESVVASIAVFGREVGGVPVIGGGSKVAVWFAADRQPVAFDVDWPAYTPTRVRQAVLPRERLFERVRATAVAPQGSGRDAVSRFECGYVDLGATSRGASMIQAGCAVHYAGRSEDGSLRARVEFVPAGAEVIADPKWALSRLLASGRTLNTDSPEFARYVTSAKLPGAAPREQRREPAAGGTPPPDLR